MCAQVGSGAGDALFALLERALGMIDELAGELIETDEIRREADKIRQGGNER